VIHEILLIFLVKLKIKCSLWLRSHFSPLLSAGNIKLVEEHPVEAAGVATVAGLASTNFGA
jgi:hypothetical protein